MSYMFSSKARWGFAAVAASAVLIFATGTSAQFSSFQIPSQEEAAVNAAAALAQRCPAPLPTPAQLKTALTNAFNAVRSELPGVSGNGILNFNMWGTVVNRTGEVCAVAFTGPNVGDQWPGSRVISAQKANTANSLSLPGFALSTANLFFQVQGGQSLFGLQSSNPVDTSVAYAGSTSDYGTEKDAMIGKKIGGVNVFGGGLALYTALPAAPSAVTNNLIGGIGVSGDTSCADHIIAWRTRALLKLDNVPAGVGPASGARASSDNIIFDLSAGGVGNVSSTSGFGHAACTGGTTPPTPNTTTVGNALVTTAPTGSHP